MKKDTRIRCPFCNITTWEKDFRKFMGDHDRPDGRRCVRAATRCASCGCAKAKHSASGGSCRCHRCDLYTPAAP